MVISRTMTGTLHQMPAKDCWVRPWRHVGDTWYYCARCSFWRGEDWKKKKNKDILWLWYHRYPSKKLKHISDVVAQFKTYGNSPLSIHRFTGQTQSILSRLQGSNLNNPLKLKPLDLGASLESFVFGQWTDVWKVVNTHNSHSHVDFYGGRKPEYPEKTLVAQERTTHQTNSIHMWRPRDSNLGPEPLEPQWWKATR